MKTNNIATYHNRPSTQYESMEDENVKKPFFTPTRVLIGGIALGALGFGAYKFFEWWKQNKNGSNTSDLFNAGVATDAGTFPVADPPKNNSGTKPPSYSTSPASDFPLKKGSKGEKVRQLQEALIAKFGKTLMPKYGADGQFGSELTNALKAKGLPATIDEQQFTILTSVDTTDTATKIYNALTKKDFSTTVAALKTLRDTNDYKTVGDQFKAKRFNGVSTTLVTGALNTFSDPSQKQQIQLEFSRMGLKYDGTKWSIPEGVAGLPARQIIAVRPTKVWQDAKHALSVGTNVVLGREIASSGGITLFDTVDGFRLYVMTGHVRYM
jgi:hypothetical protein